MFSACFRNSAICRSGECEEDRMLDCLLLTVRDWKLEVLTGELLVFVPNLEGVGDGFLDSFLLWCF